MPFLFLSLSEAPTRRDPYPTRKQDLEKGSAPLWPKACKFYDALGQRLVSAGAALDVLACALDQCGMAEMRSMVDPGGGYMVLAETFRCGVFEMLFDCDGDSVFGIMKRIKRAACEQLLRPPVRGWRLRAQSTAPRDRTQNLSLVPPVRIRTQPQLRELQADAHEAPREEPGGPRHVLQRNHGGAMLLCFSRLF